MSDLGARFRRLIRNYGPMPVARFMGESNAHYYASRNPLGAAESGRTGGDFITAPEISQMFGEMAGLWLADIWQRAGSPSNAAYVELGPGRGTLAKDALRVLKGQGLEPSVHLVEGSPALREMQGAAVPQALFHDDLSTLPDDGPLLLVANEFLDALPIRQLVKTESGWRERMIALDGEDFVFAAGPNAMDDAVPPAFADCPVESVIETCPGAASVVDEVARRLAQQGGAAVFIDYGHLEPRTGSTLQAVRAHRKVDALAMPGDADLTAHVDFSVLAERAASAGNAVHMTTQGAWLTALGIGMRAQALTAAHPGRAQDIAAAHDRLVADGEMGTLFKVAAFTGQGWPEGAGFV